MRRALSFITNCSSMRISTDIGTLILISPIRTVSGRSTIQSALDLLAVLPSYRANTTIDKQVCRSYRGMNANVRSDVSTEQSTHALTHRRKLFQLPESQREENRRKFLKLLKDGGDVDSLSRRPNESLALSQGRGPTVSADQAFVPPSTVRFAPVIYEDSGPATNDTKAATSSTLP